MRPLQHRFGLVSGLTCAARGNGRTVLASIRRTYSLKGEMAILVGAVIGVGAAALVVNGLLIGEFR